MGFGSFNNILIFGLGILIDLGTLGYYRLGLKDLKSFIKKSVVDSILGRSYESPLNMRGCTTTSRYPRRRRYLWRRAWERPDVGVMKKGRIDIHELVLGLRDLREEIKMLKIERTNLLTEIKTLKTLASDGISQECRKTLDAPQLYHKRNPVKRLRCLFSYLSERCHIEHKYWKRNLATALSRLLEFPEYVHARFSVKKMGGKGMKKKLVLLTKIPI